MVQVNLLSKRKGVKKKRNLFNVIGLGMFSLFALYFLFEVISLIYRLVNVNQRLAQVKRDTQTISSEILKNNVQLNQFILTKYILDELITLRAKQFDYPGYLTQVSTLTPAGTELTGVDFSTPGFVSVRTISDNIDTFKRFEETLRGVELSSTKFTGLAVNSISRSEDGTYRSDLLFGVKANGTNK